MADAQRDRVYAAEDLVCALLAGPDVIEAFGARLTRPVEMRFGALEHVQAYADAVLARVADVFPSTGVQVVTGRRDLRRRAYATGTRVVLPQAASGAWAWREMVVLHEIAHTLTDDQHGPRFCAALLLLVERMVGPEAAWLLRCALHEHGATVGSVPTPQPLEASS